MPYLVNCDSSGTLERFWQEHFFGSLSMGHGCLKNATILFFFSLEQNSSPMRTWLCGDVLLLISERTSTSLKKHFWVGPSVSLAVQLWFTLLFETNLKL